MALICPAAAASTLSGWEYDPATYQFTVTLPNGVAPRFFTTAEPARIILEIPQTQLGQVDTGGSYDGPIRSVRLSQSDGGGLRVVLELAPGEALAPNQAQLTSMTAGDQTRWVLTPLIAETGTVATEAAGTNPANIRTLPDGSAVPTEADGGASAVNTAGEDTESLVIVPSLPLSTPLETASPLNSPPTTEATPGPDSNPAPEVRQDMVVELPVIPAAEAGLAFPEAGQGRLSTTATNLMLPSDVEGLENLPETLPIDPFSIGLSSTEQVTVPGLDELDAVVGPVATAPQNDDTPAIAANHRAEPVAIEASGAEPSIPAPEATLSPDAAVVSATPGPASADINIEPVLEPITQAPPATAGEPAVNGTNAGTIDQAGVPIPETTMADRPTDPLPPPQANSVVIPVEASPPATEIEANPAGEVLAVPELPATDSTATVVPPNTPTSTELMVAASEPINFGQPLPQTNSAAINAVPAAPTSAPQNHQVPPDILIAAGTVLQLRYPGNEPLILEPGTDLKEVLILESEIRDPITQGVLAPRGSQLIGQFEPNGTNQQWVSEMLIVPAGQRVPLSSTSEYLVGTPQVNGGRMAVGVGAGALALALLTSFSGIGLLGGAIVGATTMVGTSPQQVVIEPNQIIAVQVTENVPRSMPIAAGPDLSREWGVE
jgi:hypothetical protein